jgi:hypothetical protein
MPARKKTLYLQHNFQNMIKEEQIKMIAETLLPGFIPKNQDEKELSFHFTVPPGQSFKVFFERKNDSEWNWKGYEPAEN